MQTAIGHWAEMMFPLFSILRREPHFQWPPAQFVLLHLKRVRASPALCCSGLCLARPRPAYFNTLRPGPQACRGTEVLHAQDGRFLARLQPRPVLNRGSGKRCGTYHWGHVQVHLMEWVRAVMAATLGVPPDQDLPPLIMQREVASVWDQIRAPSGLPQDMPCSQPCLSSHVHQHSPTSALENPLPVASHVGQVLVDISCRLVAVCMHGCGAGAEPVLAGAVSPLEGYGPREWVCFQRALVVRDSFAGGERTFLTTEDAQAFRARIYQQHGAPAAPRMPAVHGSSTRARGLAAPQACQRGRLNAAHTSSSSRHLGMRTACMRADPCQPCC